MIKNTNKINHKNLELFRYYLSKDMSEITNQFKNNNYQILGYFIASLVDILIVIIFNDYLNKTSISYKICIVIGLIFTFVVLSHLIIASMEYINKINWEKGLRDHKQILITIDEFDNIACDCLLICSNYIESYNDIKNIDDKTYIRDFYYFEIIHYLNKSCKIYQVIKTDKKKYISTKNDELISDYRIANFIKYAQEINKFLQNEKNNYKDDENIKNDLLNINSNIKNMND